MKASPLAHIGPRSRFGSTANVIISGGSTLFLTTWGIVHGAPQFFLVAAVFAGMCVFGFIPVMRKAYAAKRAASEGGADGVPLARDDQGREEQSEI